MNTIAKRLEFFLTKKNGGNQSELARYCGVTPQAVQKWLAGKSEPRGKNLELVSEFLNVAPVELKFGEQLPTKSKKAEESRLQYPPEIEEVIHLMMKSDERGRLKMKLAAIDAYELHNSHITRTKTVALDDDELKIIEKRRKASEIGKSLIDEAADQAFEDEKHSRTSKRA